MPERIQHDRSIQLRTLLAAAGGVEHPEIDFKIDLNFESPTERAELAKDVAAQANLPGGGNLVYGARGDGTLAGLQEEPDVDRLAAVISGRLQFAPPGIEINKVKIEAPEVGRLPVVLWIRIPACPYAVGTCFLAADSNWKMPIRVDSTTKLLGAGEALSLYLQRERDARAPSPHRYAELSFASEPDSVSEVLDSNLLPITSLPRDIWTCKTSSESEEEVRRACSGALPPFRVRGSYIVSLRTYPESRDAFAPVCTADPALRPLAPKLRDRDWRRVIISLVNSEISQYALSRGLAWDSEGKRAYFTPDAGMPRKVVWRAFSRRAPRTVVGIRTRGNTEVVDHWYHLAVGLRIQDLGDKFALALSSTWFFTKDGTMPLHSFLVAQVATPRMNLEDNARILYNTQFWAQYLSDGRPEISIPLCNGSLMISTQTYRLLLPFGLRSDQIQAPDISVSGQESPPEIVWFDVAPVDGRTNEDLEQWN
jgi:hypothetical protein